MAVVSRPDSAPDSAASQGLQEMARRHLWMHFSRMGSYGPDHEIPIIVRGDGCYVYDDHGNRYLDGLSGLFCVNAGHGRTELGRGGGAPDRRARLLHALELCASARDRAGRPPRRVGSRRPQPRLLHLRRLGVGRVGDEARPQLPPGAGQRPEAQDRSPARSPTTAPRSGRSPPPASPSCARSSSRSPRAAATSPTPTSTAGPRIATRSGRRPRSRSGSSSRARRRSRR